MKLIKAIFLASYLVFLPFLLSAQNNREWTIPFAYNQSELALSAKKLLAQIATFSKEQENYTLLIQGHTDPEGGKKYNQKLSQARAQVVKDYLTKLALNPENIQVEAFDFSRPRSSNQYEQGRAENRRTEIYLSFTPKLVAKKETKELFVSSPQPASPLELNIHNGSTSFTWKKGQPVHIIGPQGTEIRFDADKSSAKFASYMDGQKLEVHLKEFISPTSIQKNQLSTYSNGQLLQSRGMIYLDINSSSRYLTEQGLCMDIFIPGERDQAIAPYLVNGNQNLRNANWQEANDIEMRYDEEKKGYWLQVCNFTQGGLNLDKPVNTLALKVKNRHRGKRAATVKFKDGSTTNLRQIGNSQYYLFPNLEDGYVSGRYRNQGKTYRLRDQTNKIMAKNAQQRKQKTIRLEGENYPLLRGYKLRFRKI